MKFTAAGDAIIQRRIQKDFVGFGELFPFIARGDARFFNLETTLNREGECFASQFSGGTYLRADPNVLHDLKKFGFNMTSFNNNHAMDFSYEGLIKTLEALDESELVHGGVGRNLGEASSPVFLETENGRVALISVNTSFDPAMMAGVQSKRVPGRPGINGVRLNSEIKVSADELEAIKSIAQKTKINAQKEIERAEGYHPALADNETELGGLRFTVGDKTEYIVKADERDVRRIEEAIYEASYQADYVMISVHSHQLTGDKKETPADFLRELCRRCIDMGADAVVGHGPHLLRPIEIYNDKPIFYSLGDFILQLYNVEFAPEDFFAKYGMTSENTLHDLLAKRSRNFSIGLMEDVRMFRSVIPYWETKDKKITRLELLPLSLTMSGNNSLIGLPRVASDPSFLEALAEMSSECGLKIDINKNGASVCRW